MNGLKIGGKMTCHLHTRLNQTPSTYLLNRMITNYDSGTRQYGKLKRDTNE